MTKFQTEYIELARRLKQLDGQLDRPAIEELKTAKGALTSRWQASCKSRKHFKAELAECQLELMEPAERAAVEQDTKKQIALLRGDK